MNAPCREFRASLERHLTGEPSPASLTSLGWHEHLLGCAACRDLLAVEEALEYLLASLPDPQLPDHLVPRVLTRLRETREEAQRSAARLDHLLETGDASAVGSPNTAPQENLAGSVLAGLALDRLLERQPSEPVPVGLAERTLAGLAAGRQRLAIQARQEAALDRLLDRVPVVAVAMLGVVGAVACGWQDPAPDAFGRAMAGWVRAIRAGPFLRRLITTPQALQWLATGR